MPTRRHFLSLASMAAGMGLLAACGPASPAAAPTSAPAAAPKPTTPPAAGAAPATTAPAPAAKPTTAPAAPAAAATTAPAAAPAATAANTLTFLWGSDTDRLDPPAMTAQEGFIATTAMYEGLVRYKSGSTDVEPALAEKWDVSADGKEYIFHLKPGVKFHDGSPLTGEAVAFSFDRVINKDNPLYQDAQGDYGGFPFINDYISGVVTKVESVGALDVKFTLNRKFSPLLSNLAIPPGFVVSMEALKKASKGINDAPVGTGPFKFVEWKKEDHITVEAFDGYWGNKPKVQRIVFQPVPEPSVRALKIQRGEGDVAWPFDPKDAAAIKANADSDVLEQAGLNVNMAEFNLNIAANQNKMLRQAMNYAINKDEIAAKLYSGAGVPETGVLPPTSWAFNKDIKGYPFDQAKSRQLVKDSGYDGSSITLDTYTVARGYNPQGDKLAQAVQQYLGDVGIKTEIRTGEWTQYRADRRAGKLNIAFGGWQADTGDPENFLGVFFHSSNKGGVNTSFYGVPEVDQLLNSANEETDVAKRKDLFNQAENRIVDDAPWLFIGHMKQQIAIRKRVSGFVMQPTYIYYFNNVGLG
ncbi:MAG: ABC transporter substrate-binding protein [Chloroflexi bacterium]|nr:ABC transporter substrate-binding protein [Chloroflexota bacterium]